MQSADMTWFFSNLLELITLDPDHQTPPAPREAAAWSKLKRDTMLQLLMVFWSDPVFGKKTKYYLQVPTESTYDELMRLIVSRSERISFEIIGLVMCLIIARRIMVPPHPDNNDLAYHEFVTLYYSRHSERIAHQWQHVHRNIKNLFGILFVIEEEKNV